MLRQTAYVGPLQFEMEYGNGCEDLCFDPVFERKTGCRHSVYSVRVDLCDRIEVPEKICYEGQGFDEVNLGSEIRRYTFQLIDGRKRYYSEALWCENRIRIRINRYDPGIVGRSYEAWRFLMLEKLLLKRDAVVLHSASVIWKNQAILFTAPSGTGKSTQADLWKRCEVGVVGLNGDRNILYREQGIWFACGLPWHGSSSDCMSREVKIRAIVVVRQAQKECVTEQSFFSKMMTIYSELTLNNWERGFADSIFGLLEDLVHSVTIVQQDCTMERTAVSCLKQYLEGEGNGTL